MGHAKIDSYLESAHVDEVCPSASRGENTVVEYNIGIDVAREDYACHHEVGTDQAGTFILRAQAIRKLLWQYNH